MMANNFKYDEFLRKYLLSDLDALGWCLCFITYCHCIDDIIDGDKTDSEFILSTFEYPLVLYSNPFYLKHIHILYPIIKMSTNSYADSVNMEKTNIVWKRNYADVLRQNANDVILAVVEIVSKSREVRREASLALREISYYTHHTLEGKPC
jgi:hypothetical protein